jgi:hypothetical protein
MTQFMSIRYKEIIMDHRLRQYVLLKMPCTAAMVQSAHVAIPRLMVFPAGISWQLQNLAEERDWILWMWCHIGGWHSAGGRNFQKMRLPLQNWHGLSEREAWARQKYSIRPDHIGQWKKGHPKRDKREKGQLECVLEKSQGLKKVSRRKIATEESCIEMSCGGEDNADGMEGVVWSVF